jgi:hypothetical protein
MAQEAKAFGKAKGYADVSTRVWKGKVQGGVKKL